MSKTLPMRIFYVNIGNLNNDNVKKYLKKYEKRLNLKKHKQNKYWDTFIIPVRDGLTRVEVLK